MDALSDVLRVVGLTGGVFLDAEFTEPWSVAGKVAPELCRPFMVQPERVLSFHYIAEGKLHITIENGESAEVHAGEVVLLPRNELHFLSSENGRTPIRMSELVEKRDTVGGVNRLAHGGGGPRTKMICGFLGGNAQLEPLIASLPPIMTLRLDALPSGEWMAQTFSYAAKALGDGDPGAASVMARMSELLFVEAVRRYLAGLPADASGWLAGLRDPVVARALALLHSRLNEDWTTEALAEEVNLSRSAFAERFTQIVGLPPMRYLLNWRMQVAMQTMRDTSRTIAQVAFQVGYESEAAFTRAFRREYGKPPAAWRKSEASR